MRIYVSNLATETTHKELRTAFAPYGDVQKVGLAKDRPVGKESAYGLVEMNDESQASAAIADLNGALLRDRAIKVRGARSRGRKS